VPRTTTTAPAEVPVNLYFARGTQLGVASRQVDASADPRYTAVVALLGGPNASEAAAGLSSQIPAGTTVRGLAIRDGTATINLSPEFVSPGPPAAQSARLAQIVYTLTAYPNVTNVAITVSKLPLTSFAGVNLSSPVGRSQVTGALPDVLLEAPAVGSIVHGGTVSLSGLTSFVGTYDIRLSDSTGKLLAAVTNTAVPGATFSQTLPFKGAAPGTGTLSVFARPSTANQPTQATSLALPVQP
jgi:germination protein M